MKLQLLLLAVVALVPSLSESRTFSKCELKNILEGSNLLHGKMRGNKDYLAAIMCSLNATTGLNSSQVTVEGIRDPPTTAVPFTEPTGDPEETEEPTTTVATTTTTTTTAPTTTTSAAVNTSGAAPDSSTPSGSRRRRRRSSRKRKGKKSNELKHSKESKSSEETLYDVERKCDMQEIGEDDNSMHKKRGGSSESSEESDHMTLWSLGRYGIFQLTDSHFCDSGYRWSRNKCNTDCSAFTDDDITDDIECIKDSNYLGCFLERVPQSCWDQAKTYFDDCS
ncbi:putative peroxisomal biogenesis factor 19 [Kryptolebias marmoratus]|uniref:putative peroxisomal biogenesis factor 19 n=1 Tax=Kryptolebias marmoratus TaxID=37003 RepID=UPI0007F8CA74|nr:putative peroxisomal biogenesis factor 19 [Kryptolebias marmoratus]